MPTPDDLTRGATAATSVRGEIADRARHLARPTSVRDLPARGTVTLSACALATLLAVAGAAGGASEAVSVAVVAVAFAVLVTGWTRLVGLPSRRGTMITVGASAALLVLSVLLPRDGGGLRWEPAALAVGVVVAFVHQLVRRDGRPRVVASLSGTLLALAVLAAGTTWVAVPDVHGASGATTTAWVALVLAAGAEWACHRARLWSAIVPAALAAGLVGAALVGPACGLPVGWALVLGLGVVAPSLAVRAMISPLPSLVSQRVQAVSGVASVLVAGPVVELVARQLFG